MILLWGLASDPPLASVRDALARQGACFAHLEQRAVLNTSVELEISGSVSGFIQSRDQAIDLSAVTAAYVRPDDVRLLADVAAAGEGSAEWDHALKVQDALLCWTELTSAFVVNRPSTMASNSSKPYQLELIRACGMCVPETLITTSEPAVLAFSEEHGEIIYKSVSGVRSKVSKLRGDHLERLSTVSACPTQFQEFIAGRDYRVHVIGNEVFPSRIESVSDDYRYAAANDRALSVEPCDIPDSIAAKCISMAKGMGLAVAGVDLRRADDGSWYCFEVNPSPGFTFYDRLPNAPISEAIARLLAGGER